MKKFLLINILLLSVFCVNVCAKKPVKVQYEIDVNDTTIYDRDSVDIKPQFAGGDKALIKWLNENISYPIHAQESSIQGKVIIAFVVEKDGLITNIKITQSVHKLLDKEALRLIKKMPKWEPAIKDNKIVRCYFILPVSFVLRN